MKKIWLVGAGEMALEYVKILKDIQYPFQVIGRGENSAENFKQKTGVDVITGGIIDFLQRNEALCSHAIVAVGVEDLYLTSMLLLKAGVKNILLEKPGAIRKEQLLELQTLASQQNATVGIGYNRRFYQATEKAKEIIKEDGGVTSFNFEFTEWSHVIETLEKPKEVFENWFLANSTHVVDLAFYLGGKPKEICSYTSGALKWHKSSSIFAGAGISESGALFSYQANWAAPGRWSVEMLTNKHRLIFRPMEKLQVQNIGSVATEEVEMDYSMDDKYKPGLYKQVVGFIEGNFSGFCSLKEQIEIFDLYIKMARYNNL